MNAATVVQYRWGARLKSIGVPTREADERPRITSRMWSMMPAIIRNPPGPEGPPPMNRAGVPPPALQSPEIVSGTLGQTAQDNGAQPAGNGRFRRCGAVGASLATAINKAISSGCWNGG